MLIDYLGAATAATASVLGAGLAVAGQVPTPSGVSPDVVALVLAVGPPLTWLAYRVLAGVGAYYGRSAALDRKRADRLEKDGDAGNDNLVEILRERADRREAIASAFSAVEKRRIGK